MAGKGATLAHCKLCDFFEKINLKTSQISSPLTALFVKIRSDQTKRVEYRMETSFHRLKHGFRKTFSLCRAISGFTYIEERTAIHTKDSLTKSEAVQNGIGINYYNFLLNYSRLTDFFSSIF
jgi:hypothetical protein